jgi:hypothetical protein
VLGNYRDNFRNWVFADRHPLDARVSPEPSLLSDRKLPRMSDRVGDRLIETYLAFEMK